MMKKKQHKKVRQCERLHFQAEVLKLGGVKGFQGGREHSSGLTTECTFSNLFFVKYQNLFLQNSCILPIKSIKTLQINCYISCMFFVARWAVPYRGISEVWSPRSGEEHL